MPIAIDYTGQSFNNLTAIKYTSTKNRQRYYLFKCQLCNNELELPINSVIRFYRKSGCIKCYKPISSHRLHKIWRGMKQRCYNITDRDYKYYGSRGINMDIWRDNFHLFYHWSLANGYSSELSIDRIDNNKSYGPDNCRWVTALEQNNNQSSNHRILFDGKNLTITQWAKELHISIGTIYNRLNKNLPVDKILSSTRLNSSN